MSAVSESIAQRVTLGMLVERYGFEVDPPFATNVTITSLSDAVDTVIPGSLFICTHEQEPDVLHAAQAGAYAALLPRASKGQIANADIPLPLRRFRRSRTPAIWPAVWPADRPMPWRCSR